MCVDATDPTKGNWLRYVNWACSPEEQNLFPLEINRAIYYKVLRVGKLSIILLYNTVINTMCFSNDIICICMGH